MTVRLNQPRFVPQTTLETCWAASLESWLEAVGYPSPRLTQEQLLAQRPRGERGLAVDVFRKLVESLAMNTRMARRADFTAANLEGLLKKSYVVFIAYKVEAGREVWWHDVVLYAVTTVPGSEAVFEIMDPANGYTLARRNDFFLVGRDEPVLLGWKSVNRNGKQY